MELINIPSVIKRNLGSKFHTALPNPHHNVYINNFEEETPIILCNLSLAIANFSFLQLQLADGKNVCYADRRSNK
jgi:hypothetical protein